MPTSETKPRPSPSVGEQHRDLIPGTSRSVVRTATDLARRIFLAVGVLPLLLIVLVIVFGTVEPRFLSTDNLFNVSRQASFL